MRAVLVGAIEEVQPLVVTRAEKIRETLNPEFLRLVGTSAYTVGAGTHCQTAGGDLSRPQFDTVGGVFLSGSREQRVREMTQRNSSGGAGGSAEKVAAIQRVFHAHSSTTAIP